MGKRMFQVLKIILTAKEETISAKAILKQLQLEGIHMEIKTIYTCIQQINDFFYGWLQEDMIIAVKRKGYHINHDFFSDGELQFLLDNIAFHQDLDDEDKQKLKEKLLFFSSFSQQKRLVPYTPINRQHSFSLLLNLSVIMKAIEKKKVLSFQYIDYDIMDHHVIEVPSQRGNQNERYIVSPYQIVSQNNHYYLIAYNEKHPGQLTNYRIDRMRVIQTLSCSYQDIREQFDMSDEIENMMNMFVSHRRDTLILECSYKQLREIVSRFGEDIHVQKLYQERLQLSIDNVSVSEGLIGWIMMMQTQIKVVAPRYLALDIQKRLSQMQTLYQDMI